VSLPRPGWAGGAFGIGVGGGCYLGGATKAKAIALWPFHRSKPAARDPKDKKRILIMMSNTGGGHKASAEALRDVFHEKHGDKYEIHIEDMWKDHTPWPFNTMPDSYSFLVRHSLLWRLSYEVMQPRWAHLTHFRLMSLFMRAGLHRAFDAIRPDLVVSVHPLMQHIPIWVLKHRVHTGRMAPINFATVVTDFTTCHNTWFHTDATRCFVPTDYCAGLAARNGLVPAQVVQHGLPIRPVFSKKQLGRRAMRRRLGLDPRRPTVLLIGGGEGMGALEDTVAQLDARLGAAAQVVVVCGRNRALLEKLRTRHNPGGLKVVATGFVNNIHEWMAASDAIITKAGPGTIAEALISGLPILLNGNIPCQEEGNIPYVVENRVGAFETSPPKIARIMAQWLAKENAGEFAAMAERSRALGRPEAVYRIVSDLRDLVHNPDYTYGPAKQARTKGAVAYKPPAAPAAAPA